MFCDWLICINIVVGPYIPWPRPPYLHPIPKPVSSCPNLLQSLQVEDESGHNIPGSFSSFSQINDIYHSWADISDICSDIHDFFAILIFFILILINCDISLKYLYVCIKTTDQCNFLLNRSVGYILCCSPNFLKNRDNSRQLWRLCTMC